MILIYGERITTFILINKSPCIVTIFLWVVRALEIYSLSKFPVLTTVTMLYVRSPSYITAALRPVTGISPFSPSPAPHPLREPPFYSLLLCIQLCKVPWMGEMQFFLGLAYSVSSMSSRFIQVVANSPLQRLNTIPLCIFTTISSFMHLLMDI